MRATENEADTRTKGDRNTMNILRIMARVAAFSTLLVGALGLQADVRVDHDPVERAKSGQRIPLAASIGGDDIRVARAYFKSAAGSRFFFVPLQAQRGSDYLGVLPAPRLGSDSIDYFLLAATTGGQIVKTDSYVIDVDDDEDALARSELKQPEEIEVDLDKFEKAKDLVDRLGGSPNAGEQVPVGSETPVDSTNQIPGFDDYIVAAQQDALMATAMPLASATAKSGGSSKTTWAIIGGAAVIGAVAASGGGDGGGSSGGTPSAGPTGVQIGGDFTPPNGPQNAPIFIQLNPVGAVATPLRVRYEGSDLGTWDGTTANTDFALPALGGRAELILTSDITGGNFEIHFRTDGGRVTVGNFTASEGDFFVALPQ